MCDKLLSYSVMEELVMFKDRVNSLIPEIYFKLGSEDLLGASYDIEGLRTQLAELEDEISKELGINEDE